MLKILQARLQQYVNRELSDLQGEFRKGRGTKDQIANIHQIIEKAREFQKNIHFCFIDDAKAFDCVGHSKLWKILKEVGIPDHLICLLRNLYAGLLLLLLSRFSRVRLCATPWTAAYQFPPSMGFSRPEYCSGLPLPSPWNNRLVPNRKRSRSRLYIVTLFI